MNPKDVADLAAFLRTLPAVKGKAPANALPFPFSIRRAMGLWKLLFFDNSGLRPDPSQTEQWNRGRYLSKAPAIAANATRRVGFLGEMDSSRALAGAPLPDGHGKAANLRGGDFLNWTDADIVEALTSGFTPGGDVLGAGMTAVVRNLAELPESDRQAIAVYLKSLPPLGTRRRRSRNLFLLYHVELSSPTVGGWPIGAESRCARAASPEAIEPGDELDARGPNDLRRKEKD